MPLSEARVFSFCEPIKRLRCRPRERNELGGAGLIHRVRAQMRSLRGSAPTPKAPKGGATLMRAEWIRWRQRPAPSKEGRSGLLLVEHRPSNSVPPRAVTNLSEQWGRRETLQVAEPAVLPPELQALAANSAGSVEMARRRRAPDRDQDPTRKHLRRAADRETFGQSASSDALDLKYTAIVSFCGLFRDATMDERALLIAIQLGPDPPGRHEQRRVIEQTPSQKVNNVARRKQRNIEQPVVMSYLSCNRWRI